MGKPGSPWQGGPWPSRTTWLLSTELLGPGCPCPPPATVWCGQDCALGASGPHMGRQPPAPGGGGTGHPTRRGPEGLSREVRVLTCSGHGPHLPLLTHASSHVHTRSYAQLCTQCCVLVHMHAMYTYAHAYSCTCDHTCTHVCTHMLTAHAHVWACSHALVHSCALTHSSAHAPRTPLPVQRYMRTHTSLHGH